MLILPQNPIGFKVFGHFLIVYLSESFLTQNVGSLIVSILTDYETIDTTIDTSSFKHCKINLSRSLKYFYTFFLNNFCYWFICNGTSGKRTAVLILITVKNSLKYLFFLSYYLQ